MGGKQAYRDRIADGTPRTNNPSGYVPGGPASGGTDGWYDCDDIINDSIRNTGLNVLPHTTGTGRDAGKVRGANLWYSRGNPNGANGCPEFPRERGVDNAPNYGAAPRQLCPYATANGATIMNGPVYRYDAEASDTPRALAASTGTGAGSCTTTAAPASSTGCSSIRPPTRTGRNPCTPTACATR